MLNVLFYIFIYIVIGFNVAYFLTPEDGVKVDVINLVLTIILWPLILITLIIQWINKKWG